MTGHLHKEIHTLFREGLKSITSHLSDVKRKSREGRLRGTSTPDSSRKDGQDPSHVDFSLNRGASQLLERFHHLILYRAWETRHSQLTLDPRPVNVLSIRLSLAELT